MFFVYIEHGVSVLRASTCWECHFQCELSLPETWAQLQAA